MKSILSLIILLVLLIAGSYLTVIGALGLYLNTSITDLITLVSGLVLITLLVKGYFKD